MSFNKNNCLMSQKLYTIDFLITEGSLLNLNLLDYFSNKENKPNFLLILQKVIFKTKTNNKNLFIRKS